MATRALNPYIEIGTVTDFIKPLKLEIPDGVDPEELLILGPPEQPGANPGLTSVWAAGESYYRELDRQNRIEHVPQGFGFGLETHPARIPEAELNNLLKSLIEHGLVPKRNVSSTVATDLVEDVTARTLAGMLQVDTDDVVEKIRKVTKGRVVLGPRIKRDEDGHIIAKGQASMSAWGLPTNDPERLQSFGYKVSLARAEQNKAR